MTDFQKQTEEEIFVEDFVTDNYSSACNGLMTFFNKNQTFVYCEKRTKLDCDDSGEEVETDHYIMEIFDASENGKKVLAKRHMDGLCGVSTLGEESYDLYEYRNTKVFESKELLVLAMAEITLKECEI